MLEFSKYLISFVEYNCNLLFYLFGCYFACSFDNYVDSIHVGGQQFEMTLWDTAGQEDYERLRPLSYPNVRDRFPMTKFTRSSSMFSKIYIYSDICFPCLQTDCFLVCFSISARSSFENVASKWHPEIKANCPNVPIVLVDKYIHLTDK